jgi:nucleoside-diphosphate-sugar epimerase
MRVFLTGGTGYIGSRVAKMILEKTSHELMVLMIEKDNEEDFQHLKNERVKIIRGNLTSMDEWAKKLIDWQPDAAIHLAWEGIPLYGPELSLKNFCMSYSLVRLLTLTTCKKFIGAGSCWEYGQTKGVFNENSPIMYRDAFTSAKISLYSLGRAIAEHHDMKFIWPRIFYVYGTGQKSASLMPTVIRSILNNEKLNIKAPNAQNDYVYVDDVAEGFLVLLEKCQESGVYNIGTGKPISNKEIIDIVYEELNHEKPDIDRDIPSDVCYYADATKIRALGWKPRYSIEEGIRKTLKEQGLLK